MKKALIITVIIFAFVIAIACGVYGYYGGFKTITFEVKGQYEDVFVYEDVAGNYGQAPIYIKKVKKGLLNEFKIVTTQSAGIYYDNPQQVKDVRKLRSEIGCIINTTDSARIAAISTRFKVKRLPDKKYIIGQFPYKGSVSIFIGLIKVYPALNEFVEANGYNPDGPVIEIYDELNKTIIYKKEAIKK